MKENKKGSKKKAGIVVMFFVGLVSALVLLVNVNEVVEETIIEGATKKLQRAIVLGDAPLAAGVSGVCYVMAYPFDSTPESGYDVNLSNATAYEFYDGLDSEMTGETPYSTAFDFIVKVRWNNTHAYNSSIPGWDLSHVNSTLTVDFDYASDVGPDAAMSEIQIDTDGTTYLWVHYYLNNSGSGYQISQGETYNATNWEGWSYF